jgi:hypothetical protein
MSDDDIVEKIRKKYERLSGVLDERSRRVWAAAEAEALGYGGQSIVAKATGLSRMTFYSQKLESSNENNSVPPQTRIRKKGGGRKKLTQREPKLLSALEALVEPTTRGDPENPLRWTCLSTRQLTAALEKQGYRIGRQTVAYLLDELGYSLQGNQKTKEGSSHPDRDAQFRYIHDQVENFQRRGQPVAAVVDTHGARPLSDGDAIAGDRRWRGQQWLKSKALEGGAATTGRPNGTGYFGMPFSSRNQQME